MKFKNTIKTLVLTCLMMMGTVTHAVPLVPGTSFTSFGITITQADFNGDGNMDIIESSAVGGVANVQVSLADGQGGFAALTRQIFTGLTNMYVPLTYDMDGDGNVDLLIDDGAGLIYQALGAGDGTFATTTTLLFTLPANTALIDTVDMNSDGRIDFVAYANVANNVVVVLYDVAAVAYAAPASYSSSSVSGGFDYNINVADVNNDSNPDVIVQQSNTPSHIAVLLGDGAGGLVMPPVTYPLSVATLGSRLADVNGDGFLDVVASIASAAGDSLAVLLNNGAGGFGAETLYPLSGTPNTTYSQLEIADFNLDGQPDVLSAQYQKVAVLLGDGAGGFATPLSFPFISGIGGASIFGLVAADINGDAKPDVVVKADDGTGILTYSNFPLINASTTSLITGAIVINGGNATTTNAGVTLNLTCVTSTGAACANSTTMAFLNDGGAWSTPVAWSASAFWTVPAGVNLDKTVSVQFADVNGNISSTASDTIRLVSPSSGSNSCLAPSQSSALYLFMLLGLLFAGLQIRARKN